TLPEEVQQLLADGRISAGHARAIASSSDPAALARQVVERRLSVRETEALARRAPETKAARPRTGRTVRDADTAALENDLAETLGLDVELRHKGDSGELRIKYATLEQLDDLCRRLMR
ncbi:MAG TPA: chromosome partitioning protein ParB, partial [Caulobacteraceae bacterium]